jgi:hypothetical protein
MKKLFLCLLAAGLFSVGVLSLGVSEALAKDGARELKALRNFSLETNALKAHSPNAGENGPGQVTVLLIPEFHQSSHDELHTVMDGVPLKSAKGRSTVGTLTFLATKPIVDWFSLSFIYQYGYADYTGGLLVMDEEGWDGESHIEVEAHLAGFLGDFKFKQAGNFQVSLLEVWDLYKGHETAITPWGTSETRRVDAFDDRVFSFLVWWDKDFAINEKWTMDPYLGWRSVKVYLMDMNDWSGPSGQLMDGNSWTHLIAGGIKFKYASGLFGFYSRVGFNYRTTKDDVVGYTSRAVAPGVTNLGFMTSWDRTVGSFGLGVNYVMPGSMILDFGYNGAAGKDTLYHTLSLSFIFPF